MLVSIDTHSILFYFCRIYAGNRVVHLCVMVSSLFKFNTRTESIFVGSDSKDDIEVEELGAVALERREVHIVPRDDTWSVHEQSSGKFQIKSAEEETWTETDTSTTSYDKWIPEVEREKPVPPLVYPVLMKNMMSRKRCIFEACTVTTKKLREHVERTHIPWSVSCQCLDLEKAKQFFKLLGRELGAHSFRELLRIIVEQKLYPAAKSNKALSAADQENMQLFE